MINTTGSVWLEEIDIDDMVRVNRYLDAKPTAQYMRILVGLGAISKFSRTSVQSRLMV
jgi:hypothetical protein